MHGFYRWSGKWWPGLIPLALLWIAAAWISTVPLEADLAARAAASLQSTVLDRTRIVVAGRDVKLSADAFSGEGRSSAVAQVESVPGVRLVEDSTRLVGEARPYVWTAERDVVRVTLGGNTPLPATRARLMDAARAALGGVEVADRMGFARGAPARFDAAALLLIDQIAKLKDGKFLINDNKVSVSGMARDIGGREAIVMALRNLPEGFAVTSTELKAPPYVFQANKDPVATTLRLTGYVPDNAVHAALVEAAQRKFVYEKIVDNLKASVGAPRDFAAAVTRALGSLSRLSTGTLVVSEREVKLSGDALYDVAAADIRDSLPRELPQGWKAVVEISVKPQASPVDSSVCQQLLKYPLAKARIRFQPNSAAIDPDSTALIDQLAEIVQRCPTTTIEVAGHTDGDGSDEINQALSEKRAQAVIDRLASVGLPPERFIAVGYGSSQPVAANDTDDGKAQNRRIEFLVR